MLGEMQISESLNLGHSPQSCSHPCKVKIVQGQQKAPLRPLVTKKVVNVGEGPNQETTGTREYSVKELFHFVNRYHQLPEEILLKWIMRVTNLGAVSLGVNAAEWKSLPLRVCNAKLF